MKASAARDAASPAAAPETARGRTAGRGRIAIDRDAATAVVQAHQRAVYGFLRARLHDGGTAEDLCQEVFLRYLTGRTIPADRPGEQMAWLVGIARNVLREHVRRCVRRKEVSWTALCLDVESGSADDGSADEETLARLPACLDGLGQTARSALDMHYGESLRLAEIAGRFGRSEGAVKLLLFRARQAVRRCLEQAAGREARGADRV